ncbi:MAG: 50S ribosomal protein L6 [Candidatus Micrarchaeia archaeon]
MQVEIPKEIEAKVDGEFVIVSGKLGSSKARINRKLLDVKIEGNKINIESSQSKKLKRVARMAENALAGRLKGLFEGVQNGIERKMVVAYVHFPIALELSGNTLIIKNIFGERAPRKAKIVGNTKLEIKGQDITVKGIDPYEVGQTITNIEKACKITEKDTRVFQDGIYSIESE